MLIYYMLRVTVPNFLFLIKIAAAGRVISAVTLAFLRLHSLLKPFPYNGLNGGHQISYLLVPPFLGISGLKSSHSYRGTILVVPATFFGVVSQMGAALVLAVLAELCGLGLLWDLFTGISRCRMLLGTSLGDCGSS
jgi:hypothetical protein